MHAAKSRTVVRVAKAIFEVGRVGRVNAVNIVPAQRPNITIWLELNRRAGRITSTVMGEKQQ
jgi:hypothetical protein